MNFSTSTSQFSFDIHRWNQLLRTAEYIYIYNELCTVCIYIYVYIHYSVSWLDVPSLHTVSFIHSTKYRTLVKYIYKPIRNK